MDRVVLKVKQGEELNIGFTIKQGGQPFDLSSYNVLVQVKNNPTVKSKALIDKVITTVSDTVFEPSVALTVQVPARATLNEYVPLVSGAVYLVPPSSQVQVAPVVYFT